MPGPPAPATQTQSRGFRSFLRLITMLRPFRGHVIVAAMLALAVVGFGLTIPYFTGVIINDIDAGKYGNINRDVALLIGAAVMMALLNASRRLVAGTISLGLEKSLREQLFDHLSGLSFHFFDRHQTGQLLSRLTGDVTQVRFFLGYGLTYFFMHAAKLVAIPIIAFMISPALAAIALTMMPIIFYISLRYSRRSHHVLKEVQQREADVTAAAEENIVGARVVRAFGQEQPQIDTFRELTGHVVETERQATVLRAKYQPLYPLVTNIALAAVVLVSGHMIDSKSLTIGAFFAFYGYMLQLTGPVRIVGNLLGRAQRATASGERLWELLDEDDRLPMRDEPAELPAMEDAALAGAIRFDHVSFSYADGRPVIHDISLDIPAGATVALLGPTGCGKTTLTALVPRFYDPDRGTVTIDGVDVRELDVHELRRAVGIVGQEPFLFSASIAENLRFGAPDASDEAVRAALEAAQAAEFIDALPEGIETVIGERGVTLSGGQRQRLAIARALIVDPRILVLDDATASVDSNVESRITSALGSATIGRTTIIIAHRPSTIALADHIVMLDGGAIVDQGSHDELLERSAAYRSIHEQRAARREFLIDPADDPDESSDGGLA